MPVAAVAVLHHMSYIQAAVVGLVQGITELFPLSSLGHSVLIPALFGWHNVVNSQHDSESFYLAFVVGLHVATSLALLLFFWRDWVRIITAGFRTLGKRRMETSEERLFWLLVVVTIPAGVLGLAFEHRLRTLFAKPTAAAVFLFINGLILFGGERLRRRAEVQSLATVGDRRVDGVSGPSNEGGRDLATLSPLEAFIIGIFQSTALLAGISRSGVTMVGGLLRGLNHEDAAKFSFLAATPVIFAAGLLKFGDLTGPLGNGQHGQIIVGSLLAFVAAYLSVRFLVKYFQTRTLTPFAIYCLIAGGVCAIGFGTGLF